MASRKSPAASAGALARPTPLAALSGALLAMGLVLCLGFLGLPGLLPLAAAWRKLLGLAALPAAVALAGAGALLWPRRDGDPWALPWGRLLLLEMAVLAALTLGAAASGATDGGPGGLVGRAVATVSAEVMGRPLAILVWLALGSLAILALLGVGAPQLAARLERLTQGLAAGRPDPAAKPGTVPPPARPAAPAAERSTVPTGPPATGKPRKATAVPTSTATGSAPPSPIAAAGATSRSTPATAGSEIRRSTPAPATAPAAAAPPAPPTVTTYAGAARAGSVKLPRRPAHLPPFDLLDDEDGAAWDEAAARAMARRIEDVLAGFGAPARVASIERGPTLTRFGLAPGTVTRGGGPQRVKVAQIKALKDDLALALAVRSLRLEAPVAGRPLVGLEIPNPESGEVRLKGLLTSPEGAKALRSVGLLMALGRDVTGAPVLADLVTLPHLLIAGTTGSGKSVCLHAILASLLFQASPETLRLVVVDPKRVELARYQGLAHLVAPVVTDPAEAIGALRWVVAEMEARYRRFEAGRVRDRAAYNTRRRSGEAPLPALVLVVDELADLILAAPEEVEPLVARLAQLGRAAGIHLVLATQRPSTDVVTGLIKANFPARIAFAVASGIDSRVILDQVGAEALLGRGDLLYQAPDAAQPLRAQGVYVAEEELGRLLDFWANSHWRPNTDPAPWRDLVPTLDADEALFEAAVKLAGGGRPLSASYLQRRLHVGYGRAREVFERLVEEGFVDEEGRGPGNTGEDDDDLDWVDREFGSEA